MDYKFSIIVPVYNTGKYLKDCVGGVTNQTYSNYELLLVNNGSEDDSEMIIDHFVDDKKIKKFVIKKNNGISGARNLGINKSTGDYIIFLDSDDFYADYTFLERLNQFINEFQSDLITFKTRAYYEDTDSFGAYRSDFCIAEINKNDKLGALRYLVTSGTYESASWDKVIKREILIQNNLYFKDGIRGEDVEWFYRVVNHVKDFKGLDGDILFHRVTKTSTSQQKWEIKIWKDIYGFMAEVYPNIKYGDELQLLTLGNYADYWYILLGMASTYKNRKDLYGLLDKIKGYRKINFSIKNKICNILVAFLGKSISSKIIYKYLRG